MHENYHRLYSNAILIKSNYSTFQHGEQADILTHKFCRSSKRQETGEMDKADIKGTCCTIQVLPPLEKNKP